MRRLVLAAVCLASLAALGQPARGARPAKAPKAAAAVPASSTCARWSSAALIEGPAPLSFYDADFGVGRRACPRNELSLGVGGGAVIDVPAFYANLGASLLASASYVYTPKLELFGTVELVRYDWVQNATLKGSMIRLGQLTVGASYLLWDTGTFAVAPVARVMLPVFLTGARTFGLEVGAAGTWRITDRFDAHAYLSLDGSGALLSPGDGVFRGGLGLELGAQYNVTDWFGALLGAKLHAFHRNGLRPASQPLDYLAPLLGLRFAFGKHVGAELSATLPLLGADRHDALGLLRVTYRL